MIKKEILLRPLDPHPIEELSEPQKMNVMDSITELSMDEANMQLSSADKRRWCEIKNATANLYYLNQKGIIEMVPPAGWWY